MSRESHRITNSIVLSFFVFAYRFDDDHMGSASEAEDETIHIEPTFANANISSTNPQLN